MEKDWFLHEKMCYNLGYKNICGVDEAGRGPIAGPVFAAAVIFPENIKIDGINDSKKLNSKKREFLCEIIKEKALSYSINYASVEEIENLNILNATALAMKRAINDLKIKPDFILVDGVFVKNFFENSKFIIKGDNLSFSIAAASILAKVYRDNYMNELDIIYKQYNFKKNKGYGTKFHVDMIKMHGTCSEHRKLFLRKILNA